MIKKLLTVCMLLLTFMTMCSAKCSAWSAKKPLSPLQIRIAPVQPGITSAQIKPGDIIELKITAVSFIDVQEMRIEVELIGGAKLVSGDMSWSGPASRNEEKTIVLTVRAPEKGKGRINARLSIPPSDSTRFSAETQYVLGPEDKSKPEHEHPVKKDSKGRNVIEYR